MCGEGGVLVEKLKKENIRVIEIGEMKKDISLVDEFRSLHFIFRTLYAEKPDVFHTNSSKMGGIGNLAARLAGVRKITFTAHGWEFNAPRPWWARLAIKFFTWLTVMLSHKTICVSEKTCDDIRRLPFLKNKLRVVRNGIEKFDVLPRIQAREKLGIENDGRLVVGTLAELHPVKGVDILLEAWQSFSKKHETRLVIIGEGEAKDELEELAKILGISDSVTFMGYVENARNYLSAFDIFVLPSRSEALPYTVLEAGFAGVAVIATNVGGIPEIIKTGVNGVLIDPEEPDTLFSTLILLAENKDLRKRLGENLKETIITNFSAKKMAERTLSLYL